MKPRISPSGKLLRIQFTQNTLHHKVHGNNHRYMLDFWAYSVVDLLLLKSRGAVINHHFILQNYFIVVSKHWWVNSFGSVQFISYQQQDRWDVVFSSPMTFLTVKFVQQKLLMTTGFKPRDSGVGRYHLPTVPQPKQLYLLIRLLHQNGPFKVRKPFEIVASRGRYF